MLSMKSVGVALVCFGILQLHPTNSNAEDQVELLNGTRLSGQMIGIRKDDREFDFESSFGGKLVKQTYAYDKIHAVTFGGKRFVITPMTESAPMAAPMANAEATTHHTTQRTKAEVLQFIEDFGSTEPDWLASTQMNHPETLDLEWPLKTEGKWDESTNVGQYIWGRVSPNEARWKPGIKLVYECMKRHQQNRTLLVRDMEKLGDMYFTLLQDYPRAAYWLQKADASVSKETGIFLAECYWRLGNKELAFAKLQGNLLHFNAIKLYGDMDEIEMAMNVANVYAKTPLFNEACLKAGDALRGAGRLDEAITFYEQVLDRNEARNKEYLTRYKGLAQGAIDAIKLFDKADVSRVADGTYTSSTMGYNGQVEVTVKVAGSQIKNVTVSKHQEKQFYAALTDTPKQILDKQGFQDVDGTSGATITSQAIINSTARALAQGAK